ncbi:AMP-binding protein [Lutimonas zeaxanthinifaciens]|uniref:AMP-binding protein n=1 Tax=Lutimonas zeaxanthinifaciens TaxID=3060215 RepID=UPI00265C96E3|nr:AMP-binding protein [Lutimonas sp. YSD2104]WKK65882.1 AMP-binding protein [Lutimonas sp. YSD2104]
MTASWHPNDEVLKSSNIYKMMLKNKLDSYESLWQWSVQNKSEFWKQTIANLNINFKRKFDSVLDISEGIENASWLKGSKFNIVDSCFQHHEDSTALVYQSEKGTLTKVTQKELERYVNRIANGLKEYGLVPGDRIAIDMPMTYQAVAVYLAAIKAGCPVVTIADSFTSNEIEVRLKITGPKLIFTQDFIYRAGKTLPLYDKVVHADAPKAIVIKGGSSESSLRSGDLFFESFLSETEEFNTVFLDPEDMITVLFSSGTTGEPKAIPWINTVPVKCASDGYYHHNIQENDVVCWPTNLGWMMGPWLIFASLINKSTIALYYGAPMGEGFGEFVQNAKVTMLGVVPSIVRHWKNTGTMESFDWNSIKCFSSTGEASNPEEMEYLMQLGKNKPVIEYCGGTEIGGGYVTSTVVQPNIASTFSTQALGGEFVLLNEDNEETDRGEMFLIPPILGLSKTLLNRNHHEVYFEGNPSYNGRVLRRHGDQLERLTNGYYKAQGRADDAMNLGGIKVSSIQIEEVINLLDFVKESAAIAVSPPKGGPGQLFIYIVSTDKTLSLDEKLKAARTIIREQLNPLFKAEGLIEIEALPRTASGKVMRRKLRDMLQQ